MFKITGNTYNVREIIKQAGFKWSGSEWTGDAEAAEELRRITWPTYSRRNANAFSGCEIVEIVAETPAVTAEDTAKTEQIAECEALLAQMSAKAPAEGSAQYGSWAVYRDAFVAHLDYLREQPAKHFAHTAGFAQECQSKGRAAALATR